MPTDASAGDTPDSPRRESPPDGHDGLVFATHDLRPVSPQSPAGLDLGFAPVERPGEAPADEQVIFFVPPAPPAPAPPAPAPPAPAAPAPAAPAPAAPAPAAPPAPPAPFVGETPASPAPFVGEAPAPAAAAARPLSPADGFVIRETQVAPAFPVDALVVGGPLTAPAREIEGLEPNGQAHAFKISSFTTPDAPAPSAEPPWTVRDAPPGSVPAQAVARRGWSSRRNGIADGTAAAAILRLREEAVHVSWKAAWIAVTAANPRRARKR
jgi:hypothetical protein